MKELKPCPFCGGEVYRAVGFAGMNIFRCPNCGAITYFYIDRYEEAIEAWNRRTEE